MPMRSCVRPVLFLLCSGLLTACSGGGSGAAPAGTAAPSGSASSVSAVGTTTGAVLVGWTPPMQNTDSSPLTDLAGYRIYWGPNPEQLQKSVTVRTIGVTSHVVEPLPPGQYYFAVTAFNEQNVESELSEPVAAVIN